MRKDEKVCFPFLHSKTPLVLSVFLSLGHYKMKRKFSISCYSSREIQSLQLVLLRSQHPPASASKLTNSRRTLSFWLLLHFLSSAVSQPQIMNQEQCDKSGSLSFFFFNVFKRDGLVSLMSCAQV